MIITNNDSLKNNLKDLKELTNGLRNFALVNSLKFAEIQVLNVIFVFILVRTSKKSHFNLLLGFLAL